MHHHHTLLTSGGNLLDLKDTLGKDELKDLDLSAYNPRLR